MNSDLIKLIEEFQDAVDTHAYSIYSEESARTHRSDRCEKAMLRCKADLIKYIENLKQPNIVSYQPNLMQYKSITYYTPE